MIYSYFKIALRALLKFKGFAAINFVGLALGLSAGTLILVYITDELSFDQFHEKGDQIYRVTTEFNTAGEGGGAFEANGWPVGKILEREFPEVASVIYSRSASFLLVNHEGKRIQENAHFMSEDFFKMFSFPLASGNPEKALAEPFSVVLSESLAKKYFPNENALNKTLVVSDTLQFQVTGVMADLPANSHIQAGMFYSFSSYPRIDNFSYDDGWGNLNVRNYLLLKEGASIQSLEKKARNLYMDRVGEQMKNWGITAYLAFEPLREIYLHSESGNGMGKLGSLDRLYLLGGVAGFVILLACINFVNLSTARSVYRGREVGLRKVVGSTRTGLVRQFLLEAFVVTVISFLLSLVVTGLVLPMFNELLGKNYSLTVLGSPTILMGSIILVLIISALAGYYPAWVLSAIRPIEVLKGRMQTSTRGVQLRRALVVFQFVISVGLVMGTLVIIHQLEFMEKQDLGFSRDQVFVMNARRVGVPNRETFQTFKNEIDKLALAEKVALANAMPGVSGWPGQVAFAEGRPAEESVSVEYIAVDENYLDVLDLKLVAGRNFSVDRALDRDDALIINETAAAVFGWSAQEAIGKRIDSPSKYPAGEVIGVVKDYHQRGLQQKIGPVVMDYNLRSSDLYMVKYKAANTQELIQQLGDLWKATFPGFDFNYFFLDQNFEKQYNEEKKLANVFALFALVTIAIAAIGLLGLVSFLVVTRTKEIGVRKVLGANVASVVKLLSKEFVYLVVVAHVVALPLAWYFSNQWLERFAFRMAVSPMLFVWTFLIAIAITLATVSYQTIRAALADPVKALRHE